MYAYPPHPTFHNTEPVIAVIKIYNTSVHHKKTGFCCPLMSYNRYKKIINMYTLLLLTFFTCKHRDPKEKPPIAWSRGHLNSLACTLHTSQGNQMGTGGHQKVPKSLCPVVPGPRVDPPAGSGFCALGDEQINSANNSPPAAGAGARGSWLTGLVRGDQSGISNGTRGVGPNLVSPARAPHAALHNSHPRELREQLQQVKTFQTLSAGQVRSPHSERGNRNLQH